MWRRLLRQVDRVGKVVIQVSVDAFVCPGLYGQPSHARLTPDPPQASKFLRVHYIPYFQRSRDSQGLALLSSAHSSSRPPCYLSLTTIGSRERVNSATTSPKRVSSSLNFLYISPTSHSTICPRKSSFTSSVAWLLIVKSRYTIPPNCAI